MFGLGRRLRRGRGATPRFSRTTGTGLTKGCAEREAQSMKHSRDQYEAVKGLHSERYIIFGTRRHGRAWHAFQIPSVLDSAAAIQGLKMACFAWNDTQEVIVPATRQRGHLCTFGRSVKSVWSTQPRQLTRAIILAPRSDAALLRGKWLLCL